LGAGEQPKLRVLVIMARRRVVRSSGVAWRRRVAGLVQDRRGDACLKWWGAEEHPTLRLADRNSRNSKVVNLSVYITDGR
jgi:hypothetical protein